MAGNSMDIYQYDDFRPYLLACFEARKAADPSFSHRKFAQAAGIRNSGYLLDVIKGKRSLSAKVLDKVIEIFAMKPLEAEFLGLLVEYGQAKNAEDRDALYRDILNRRNHSNFVRLNPAQTRYYEDTFYPLLVAAVEAMDFRGDYDALGAFLDPPVAAGKVKKGIRDLCEWGLIRQRANGRYDVLERFLEPPATMGGLVKRLNREWILQAPDALTRFTPKERHTSSIILSISEKAKDQIREEIEKFRRKVFDIAKHDVNAEQVMQFTLLYFPKSKVSK
jgi:uncharacterized protein (TIGR02147 family)